MMRDDQPRQKSMDYWKGSHAEIISSSPQLFEYRQLHLSETEHSFWPEHKKLISKIAKDRRIDGIAEVSYQKTHSPLLGTKQMFAAFADEINIFRRTLMNMGLPWSSRWFSTSSNGKTEARDVIFTQRKNTVSKRDFRKFIREELAEEIRNSAGVTEFRTQNYLPWNKFTWNSPNIAHDNPKSEQIQASIVIGFENERARKDFYQNIAPKLNEKLVDFAQKIQSYKVEKTLVFVENGRRK